MPRKTGALLVLSLAAALFATSAIAQTAPASPPPSAHRLELAHRYMAAAHMERTLDAVMSQMKPMMMAMAPKDSKLSDADRQAIADISADVTRELMTKVAARMEPIMAETFTEKELTELTAFYESPTGQSAVNKMPVMMGKLLPAMAEFMPQMQAEMKTRICARIDCAGAAKAATPKSPS